MVRREGGWVRAALRDVTQAVRNMGTGCEQPGRTAAGLADRARLRADEAVPMLTTGSGTPKIERERS